jgi:CRP/FNR family transcriptional regulator, cyclic AMP receptor protein
VLSGGPTADHLFSRLTGHRLRQLAGIHGAHRYPTGAVLFQEGEPAEGVFLLSSGAVKLCVGTAQGDTLLLRTAGPGEILGLSATLTGQGHEVSAETTVPSELVFLKRKEFLNYLRDHTDVCMEVVESLSNDVYAAYERVRALGLARMRHVSNHN